MSENITSMSTSKTNDKKIDKLYRNFFIPSPYQIILYLLVGALLLVLIKARAIWEELGGSLIIDTIAETPAANSAWGKIASGPLPQIVFWALIGMIMYFVVWFVWNIFINLKNDMAADKFVHPRNYDRNNYWSGVLAHKAFFALTVVVFISYIVMMFKFLPVIADSAYSALSSFNFPKDLLSTAIYVSISGLLVYVFVLLLRLSANTWQSVYKDL